MTIDLHHWPKMASMSQPVSLWNFCWMRIPVDSWKAQSALANSHTFFVYWFCQDYLIRIVLFSCSTSKWLPALPFPKGTNMSVWKYWHEMHGKMCFIILSKNILSWSGIPRFIWLTLFSDLELCVVLKNVHGILEHVVTAWNPLNKN